MNTPVPGSTEGVASMSDRWCSKTSVPISDMAKHTSVASRNFPKANRTGRLFPQAQSGNKQMNREPVINIPPLLTTYRHMSQRSKSLKKKEIFARSHLRLTDGSRKGPRNIGTTPIQGTDVTTSRGTGHVLFTRC